MKVGGLLPLQRLARLKLELADVVKKEEFEKAARVRDRILALEEQLKRPASRAPKAAPVA